MLRVLISRFPEVLRQRNLHLCFSTIVQIFWLGIVLNETKHGELEIHANHHDCMFVTLKLQTYRDNVFCSLFSSWASLACKWQSVPSECAKHHTAPLSSCRSAFFMNNWWSLLMQQICWILVCGICLHLQNFVIHTVWKGNQEYVWLARQSSGKNI